ncbi:MAG: hypothetical protein MUQ27_06120 [Acidimicrobiia bacterium]|nr:hypothetical protein [Acidimicrobiia bacterium]
MEASPLPAGAFPVRATQPEAIGPAEHVMIDADSFRFGTTMETGHIESVFTLPFSEIAELRYKATGGVVSGTLRDGTELGFRIVQTLAAEEAMRPVAALFYPGTDSAVEADRIVDGLEGSLASRPLAKAPDSASLKAALEDPIPPLESGLQRPVSRISILSVGELDAVMRSLDGAFEDAAECGVESQARRFAELTAAADLQVEWIKWLHRIEANWRSMPVFTLTWFPYGYVYGGIESETRGQGVDWFLYYKTATARDAFDLHGDRELPDLRDRRGEMDTVRLNAYTDLFLDWLEVFLATHSLPSRESEAIWQTEDRLSKRGCWAATLALLTPLWSILVVLALLLLPGEYPFREPVGLVVWGLIFLIVPVLAVVLGFKARREIGRYDGTRSRSTRSAIRRAWIAIILGSLITAGAVTGFGIALTNQLSGGW